MYERFDLYGQGEAPFVITPMSIDETRTLYRRRSKRVLDLAIIALVAVPALLLIGVFAAILKLREGGAVFYCQERIGRNGRSFRMWKLRTMVPDADKVLETYLSDHPEARAEWDRHQKLRNDPRITRMGRFLRRSSLDEVPQLWNVLMGEMSIVGPRPMMCNQRVLYPGTEYYAMRPGITGYWQTSDRNDTSFHERAWYDQAYYRALSLRTDLAIILRTFSVVLRGTGH
ncbi:sugar transferase [Nioella nitratireducens]|uniref:sugar transferase n=1 Tax=Nioella nitratireducens TaxID=1287720 RepID=UPI0008FD84F2|nr:sugar transferase [Nioella nitratireducens]